MIKFFIRTTGQRKLNPSYSQINYELLVDNKNDYMSSFINQLEQVSDCDAVLLEDDVWLCSDFLKKINEVISKFPDSIINFFTEPNRFFTSHFDERLTYNQCTYYPHGVGKLISKKMRTIYDYKIVSNPNYRFQYDTIETEALRSLNLPVYIHRPCLVQHLDYKSLIQNNSIQSLSRTTIYFEDYLSENSICYMEAFSSQNKQLLHRSRFEFFTWARKQDWWAN